MANKEFQSFPGLVCERLRNLVKLEKESKSKRDDLFQDRDHAKDSFDGAENEKDREHWASVYGQKVMEIERLSTAIKAIGNEKNAAIEQADEPGLYDDAKVTLKEFLPAIEPKPKDPQKQLDDDRPIGRKPTAREPSGNTEARAIQDGYVEGVDEHLRAATSELVPYGVSSGVCAKVTALGLGTIGQLAKAIDGDTIEPDLETLKPADAKAIVAAVKKYRAAHRKASAKVEKEAAGVI